MANKQKLQDMIDALLEDDGQKASDALHVYLSEKAGEMLGLREMKDEMDYDKKDMKDDKKEDKKDAEEEEKDMDDKKDMDKKDDKKKDEMKKDKK